MAILLGNELQTKTMDTKNLVIIFDISLNLFTNSSTSICVLNSYFHNNKIICILLLYKSFLSEYLATSSK